MSEVTAETMAELAEQAAALGFSFDENGKLTKLEDAKSVETEELKSIVKEAVADQFAITDGWRASKTIKFVVTCPSGQRCLVKRLSTTDLINADILDEMDFFTRALIPQKFDAAGNPVFDNEQSSFWDALKDPEKRLRFFNLLNKLTQAAVVNPIVVDDGASIVTTPNGKKVVALGTSVITDENGTDSLIMENGETRVLSDNEVRTSQIEFTDKMQIFSEVNRPLNEIRPFRAEENSMASVGTE